MVTVSKHALEPSHLVLWTGLKRIELDTALHSVEMSVFRQITATQTERTETDGCLVWHTTGEYSVCSFPNLTSGR